MKSFKSFISEAATDDRKEVAKALKKFAKKYVSGPIRFYKTGGTSTNCQVYELS
tara:strand:+ start:333 stop:494 length:162 start_codon:yes stop_codon:yes gene_type:complete